MTDIYFSKKISKATNSNFVMFDIAKLKTLDFFLKKLGGRYLENWTVEICIANK